MSSGWTVVHPFTTAILNKYIHCKKDYYPSLLYLILKIQFCVTWANGEGMRLADGGRMLMELAEDICNRAFKCQFSGDLASQ